MFEKRRKEKRKNLIYYLEIFDTDSNELLGHLVDITSEGLLLLSEKEMESEVNINLKLMLPHEMNEINEILVNGTSVHCSTDPNSQYVDIGFRFNGLDPVYLPIIKKLISDYGFRD